MIWICCAICRKREAKKSFRGKNYCEICFKDKK